MKKAIIGTLLAAQLVNMLSAVVANRLLPKVKIDDIKLDYGEDTITFVFLGLLGEVRYIKEICEHIPGRVYYVHYNSTDYDAEQLATEAAGAAEVLFDVNFDEDDMRINCVGISLGAQAAVRMAEILAGRHSDMDLRLYLLNPCMGAQQISLVKWPIWLMEGLANAISVAVGMLGWAGFIPFLREHSLANLQGELHEVTHAVKPYLEELLDKTCVIISTQDEMADVVASAEYFSKCAMVAKIEAGHCDFVKAATQYLEQLSNQGLIHLS